MIHWGTFWTLYAALMAFGLTMWVFLVAWHLIEKHGQKKHWRALETKGAAR